jgi:serine/threonine protein kinase/tetratricopeptide (TPR) repeat protein
MTPERWRQVKSLFDGIVERAPEERDAFLSMACGSDEELRHEIIALLKSDSTVGDSLFERPLLNALPEDSLPGRSLGPYRLLRRIGHGGMGSVYLAVREDDQFHRRVAIKAVKPELVSEHAMRRFQNERQTLAALDHPNIVKLLDWGTSEDGIPYLVMDYIEGERIDQFCDGRKLPVADRLRLFLTVCAAVHYAHQNLVVHRDLKPSNILVTPQAVPKLLDFGIARLLKAEYACQTVGITRTEMQPMTPEYASPEQILGRPITTATDVYSLGVLLYRLLTHQHPFRLKTHAVLELERAICETEPEKPSLAAARRGEFSRRLGRDLDNIVLMAMRKEPQRRYASVEHLAEDIRRHLTNMPVTACGDTLTYRLGKFVRRHRAAVAASALGVLALMGSTILSIGYARTARAESERAERRFQDVRRLAEFILYDFDEAIRSGPTSARKGIVSKGLDALDRLSQESPDESLKRDLIEGYLRIGDLQGNLYGPNLGDLEGARENYQKALDMAQALYRRHGDDRTVRRDFARANQKLGEILALRADHRAALGQYGKALEAFEKMAAANISDVQAMRDLLAVYERIGHTRYQLGNLTEALNDYDRYLSVAGKLLANNPQDPEQRRALARGNVRAGEIRASCGNTDSGAQQIRTGLEALEDMAAADPTNVQARRDLASTYIILGDALAGGGRRTESIVNYRKGLRIAEALHREDPQDKQFQRNLYLVLGFLANVLSEAGRNYEAFQLMQRALRLASALADQPQASQDDHRNYAWLLLTTGSDALKDNFRAKQHAERAVAMTSSKDAAVLHTLALAHEAVGDLPQATLTEEKALALVPPVRSGGCNPHLWRELDSTLDRFRAKAAGETPKQTKQP